MKVKILAYGCVLDDSLYRYPSGKQGQYQLLAEDGVQNECTKCGRATSQFELVISEGGREYFHSTCYALPAFLHLDQGILIARTVYPENAKKLKEWVKLHNQTIHFPLPLPKKAVSCQDTNYSKALSCVFQFLSPAEILAVEGTCRNWYQASWSDAVWTRLLASETQMDQAVHTARAEYMLRRKSSCFKCGTFVTEDNLGLISPENKKPLCQHCRDSEEMQLVRVETLCRALGVDPRNGKDHLKVKGLQIRGQNMSFWGAGVEKLVELREARRRHLAVKLRHDDSLRELLRVPLDQPLQESKLKNPKAKQLAKYFMDLKSKTWLSKQMTSLGVSTTSKKRKKQE